MKWVKSCARASQTLAQSKVDLVCFVTVQSSSRDCSEPAEGYLEGFAIHGYRLLASDAAPAFKLLHTRCLEIFLVQGAQALQLLILAFHQGMPVQSWLLFDLPPGCTHHAGHSLDTGLHLMLKGRKLVGKASDWTSAGMPSPKAGCVLQLFCKISSIVHELFGHAAAQNAGAS